MKTTLVVAVFIALMFTIDFIAPAISPILGPLAAFSLVALLIFLIAKLVRS